MSSSNDLITELLRAANKLEKCEPCQQRRLLERAAIAIRDMRRRAGIPQGGYRRDALVDLKILAVKLDELPIDPSEVSSGMLQAAGMIRDLHIVLDTSTRIEILG